MNIENLRPFDTMSPEEHRELSRRGGIASGERRRHLADLYFLGALNRCALVTNDPSLN